MAKVYADNGITFCADQDGFCFYVGTEKIKFIESINISNNSVVVKLDSHSGLEYEENLRNLKKLAWIKIVD